MIKFRAWDYDEKRMHDVLVIDWLNYLVDLDFGNIERPFTRVELMLYSDLFDKNNVNICDGDIIKNHVDELWVVKYHRCAFRYYTINRFKHLFSDGIFETDNIGNFGTEAFEVLGNVYENSELLEVK